MKTELHSLYWVAASFLNPMERAFHVTVCRIAETIEDAGAQGGLKVEVTLNMEQARAEGITLETIGPQFSTEMALAREEAEAGRLKAEGERDEAIAALVDANQRLFAKSRDFNIALQALAAANAAIADLKKTPPAVEPAS